MMPYNQNETIEVLCQNCKKRKVRILANHPYFGILCSECMKPNIYQFRKEVQDAKSE